MSAFIDPATDAVMDWLLDPAEPGPRYLALRDVVRLDADDPALLEARAAAHAAPPISVILDQMHPEGYWEEPGAGYGPKYRSTVWALIALGQLGAAAASDPRIERACDYYLAHALAPGGQISYRSPDAPGGSFDCLQGNMLTALLDLGVDPARLDMAFEWMARTVTGEGLAPRTDKHAPLRYYAAKSGPLFECGANYNLPCGWGGVKVMMAFSRLPEARRTPLIDEAIRQGIEFLLSVDPVTAAYPTFQGQKPNRSWFQFGFPVFYVTDVLQIVEALVALGHGDDPRLDNVRQYIAGKRLPDGRWPMEYSYGGKTWAAAGFGRKGQPNKWVTIRAMRALGGNGGTGARAEG